MSWRLSVFGLQVFEYIMATVVRFRHGHARMTAVLGDHAASHRAHSAGLHDVAPHQVRPLSALSAFLESPQSVTSLTFDCLLPNFLCSCTFPI